MEPQSDDDVYYAKYLAFRCHHGFAHNPAWASSSTLYTWVTAGSTWLSLVCASLVCVTSQTMAAETDFPAKQLFTHHCEKCHSNGKAEGEFTVASLTDDFNDRQNREKWLTVLKQLKDGNMPPKGEPRPPGKDLQNA